MAHYRDDTHEIAVASSRIWGGLRSIVEEIVKASDRVLFGLLVLHSVAAAASDEVIDIAGSTIVEQAQASDEVLDSVVASSLIVERGLALDQTVGRLRVLHDVLARARDETTGHMGALIVDAAQASVDVTGLRNVSSLTVETARVSDFTGQAASVLIEESAQADDRYLHWGRFSELIEDGALAAVELHGAHQGAVFVVLETARAGSELFDRLAAAELVVEQAVAEGQALGIDLGQAWTANADTWAMSRYAPYTYESLAVVDGVLYGIANDGVYALDGGEEVVEGELRTGKLDLGGGALVRPVSAYLEYSLADEGEASMDVVTTQSGSAQSYTYSLPEKPASELTNGRFTFGRGLRGRHFGFSLRLTGKSGHINDASVYVAPTKRRV